MQKLDALNSDLKISWEKKQIFFVYLYKGMICMPKRKSIGEKMRKYIGLLSILLGIVSLVLLFCGFTFGIRIIWLIGLVAILLSVIGGLLNAALNKEDSKGILSSDPHMSPFRGASTYSDRSRPFDD